MSVVPRVSSCCPAESPQLLGTSCPGSLRPSRGELGLPPAALNNICVPPLATPDWPLGIAGLVCPGRGRETAIVAVMSPPGSAACGDQKPCTCHGCASSSARTAWSGAAAGELGVRQRAPRGLDSGEHGQERGYRHTRRWWGPQRRTQQGDQPRREAAQPGPLAGAPYGLARWAEMARLNALRRGLPAREGLLVAPTLTPALFQGKSTPTQQAFQEAPRAAKVSAKGREDKERSNRAQQRSLVLSYRVNSARLGLPEAPTFYQEMEAPPSKHK